MAIGPRGGAGCAAARAGRRPPPCRGPRPRNRRRSSRPDTLCEQHRGGAVGDEAEQRGQQRLERAGSRKEASRSRPTPSMSRPEHRRKDEQEQQDRQGAPDRFQQDAAKRRALPALSSGARPASSWSAACCRSRRQSASHRITGRHAQRRLDRKQQQAPCRAHPGWPSRMEQCLVRRGEEHGPPACRRRRSPPLRTAARTRRKSRTAGMQPAAAPAAARTAPARRTAPTSLSAARCSRYSIKKTVTSRKGVQLCAVDQRVQQHIPQPFHGSQHPLQIETLPAAMRREPPGSLRKSIFSSICAATSARWATRTCSMVSRSRDGHAAVALRFKIDRDAQRRARSRPRPRR